jgi:hypothetical protein
LGAILLYVFAAPYLGLHVSFLMFIIPWCLSWITDRSRLVERETAIRHALLYGNNLGYALGLISMVIRGNLGFF